jgi:hypothetical protein
MLHDMLYYLLHALRSTMCYDTSAAVVGTVWLCVRVHVCACDFA